MHRRRTGASLYGIEASRDTLPPNRLGDGISGINLGLFGPSGERYAFRSFRKACYQSWAFKAWLLLSFWGSFAGLVISALQYGIW